MAMKKLLMKAVVAAFAAIGTFIMGYGMGAVFDTIDEAAAEDERAQALPGEGEVK